MNLITSLLFLLGIFSLNVEAYKFLAIFHWPGRSHFIFGAALMKALAMKGHEVTVISPFPQKNPIKNYYDIPVNNIMKESEGVLKSLFDFYNSNFFKTQSQGKKLGYKIVEIILEEPEVKALLNSNQTFDAVICEPFFSEALYGFSDHFNAPLIGFSSLGAFAQNTDMIGSPSPPSYVPHVYTSLTERMTLWERLYNLALVTFERFCTDFVHFPRQETLYKKYFPHAKRSLYEVQKKTALMLMNQHISLSASRPYMPNQVEVGGLHINRKRSPLPDDIQKFIDESKDGVIYFSMGTNLRSTMLPVEKRNEILETFRELKQRVLWKFEEPNLPGKPENVYISDWFPQDDILAHPNVKIFITHGGLLSVIESIYHGKPIIGIPIFADQFFNMQRAVLSGYGITVEYGKLSKAILKDSIEEMLKNVSYTERVREISRRYRDQPMEPMELAVYWVEYIVRHKGAEFMHCAGLDLSFIEYHNIDIMLIIFGGIALFVCLVSFVIIKVQRKCCEKSRKSKSSKKLKIK